MKIAVLAIAKNEGKHIHRWAESALDADQIILVDTGSTDATYELALDHPRIKAHRVNLAVWRFDMARNIALSLVPADVDWVVNLDLDEVLLPGWRAAMEKTIAENPLATRLHYPYVWNWVSPGVPCTTYNRDMIHTRRGWMWKHPVHEVLYPVGQRDIVVKCPDLHVHHHADETKSRSNYLDLLRLSVMEDKENPRNFYYYARELFNYNRLDDAVEQFEKYLNLPKATFGAERSQAYNYLSQIYQRRGDVVEALKMARQSVIEEPKRRESWLRLAQVCKDTARWPECFAAASSCLEITKRTGTFLDTAEAWGSEPLHLLGVSEWRLGMIENSLTHLTEALRLDPENVTLRRDFATARSSIP